MAKLYFRYGAMGSSKTANAIMVQYNYHERGQRALMLKPRLDNRDGNRLVGSRSGLTAPCAYVEELEGMDLSGYDCLIVDEAQFLKKEQVQQLVDIVDGAGIPVICYGLRADFQGNLFEGSTWLMAWADTIEEIKTVCWCGRKATFNARVMDGRVVRSGEQILLGGNESYVALCRRHWARGELAPKAFRRITLGKRAYMALLKEADPVEAMIDHYLDDGDMYVMLLNGTAVAEAVLLDRGSGLCELMNLATAPQHRGHGYASELVRYLIGLCTTVYERMEVGTDPSTAGFYERLGFTPAYVRRDFFRLNGYPETDDEGRPLGDMQVLSLDLRPDADAGGRENVRRG